MSDSTPEKRPSTHGQGKGKGKGGRPSKGKGKGGKGRPPSPAKLIAKHLGEVGRTPTRQIRTIVKLVGPEAAWALVKQAEAIEAEGGQVVAATGVRRTFGGVFFALARAALTPEQRDLVWLPPATLRERRLAALAKRPPSPWAERRQVLDALRAEIGTATTCKVTVVARPAPGALVRDAYTMLLLTRGAPPELPAGQLTLPKKADELTLATTAKHWAAIAPQLERDPLDAAIWSGSLVYDPDLEGLAVLAVDGTTRALDAARQGKPYAPLAQAIPEGEAASVRATVVGRPGAVVKSGRARLTLMQVTRTLPIPRGFPAPPIAPTQVLVVMSWYQWRAVFTQLAAAPTAQIVVHGYPVLDPAIPGVAVFAQSVDLRP